MRRSASLVCSLSAAALIASMLPGFAVAYNPPVDASGPITVRIEGPETVTQTDAAQPVRVVVENSSDRRVEGTLEIGLVDRWTVEPAGPVKFAVEAKGKATLPFKITAGKGTYSGHYPIHAYAKFEADGKPQTAHPILILETKLPHTSPAVKSVEWKPIKAPASGELALWRVPAVRAMIAVFKEAPKTMPLGWKGSEERTGGSLELIPQTFEGQSREALVIHPPWRDGLAGSLLVEYPVQLPQSKPIKLTFANAVTPEGQGDGVTFRVRALPLDAPAGELGKIVFERHSNAHTWQPAVADLSALAGQAVRLQLESHPGPKNNTGWDRSFWAEPTLVLGPPAAPAPFPPKEVANSIALGKVGPKEDCEVRVWPGQRGLLDAAIGFRHADKQLFFRGFEVRVLGGRIDDARSPILLQEVKEEKGAEGYQVRHRFESPSGPFDLVGRLWVDRGALRARFALENVPAAQPWVAVRLEDAAAGPWSETANQVYAGHGSVIREPGAFSLSFDGHRLSTSFVGFDFPSGLAMVQGVDYPPHDLKVAPQDRHYSLHAPHGATFTFIPSANVWDGVKVWRSVNGLKAAGGVSKAAGRFVFDLWGGQYGESADALQKAFRYGLTDSMVIFHNWQRWGYDYRLPEIYPPNPKLGTLEEMQRLAEVCKKAGVLFGPHDNYIDFYPDAESFSYEKQIAFQGDGRPVKAWLNEGRGAQSYRYRADAIEAFLKPNIELIRKGLSPTAYFIDVWSSAPPYDYWTADGKFVDSLFTRKVWAESFAWIREQFGDNAPQISESGHDGLIGWLDGAQTNHLRVGTPAPNAGRYAWSVWNIPHTDAERTPWFDAAHHDRFILHGAGYSIRYQAGLDAASHGIYSDDYVTTEVLTGHPAMVPAPFNRSVVRKYWLLADLMRALAMRTIEGVEYVDGDLHRQHVRWSGGGEVWVNRGEADWEVGGVALPQYGFLASVPTSDGGQVVATIARRDGQIVEMVRTPERVYVNGRQPVEGPLPIRIVARELRTTGPRQGELSIEWQASAPIPEGYNPFMHFCDSEGEIVFQGQHQPDLAKTPRKGTIRAVVLVRVPDNAKPGDAYDLCAGMYQPKTGGRLDLLGNDDGSGRIRLGKLTVQAGGLAWTSEKEKPNAWLSRQNAEGKPIDFGGIATAGGCRLGRDGDALLVTPLPEPRGAKIAAQLDWTKLPWKLAEPAWIEAVGEDGKVLERKPVKPSGSKLDLAFDPEVFRYRLGAK